MSVTKKLQTLSLATLFTLAFVVAGQGAAYAGVCHTINTLPDWDGNITNAWLGQAQTFMAPSASCDVLLDYEFNMAGRSSAGQLQLNIFQWGTSGPVGSALFSTTVSWGTTAATYDITGINLTLMPGQLYGANVDFLGYSGQSIYFQDNQTGYPGFDGWWFDGSSWTDFPGLQTNFLADFGSSIPEPGSFTLVGTGMVGLVSIIRCKLTR